MTNFWMELRAHRDVEFEGATLRYAGEWEDLKPGDTYVAERNTGIHLLTVKEVVPTAGHRQQWKGWVIPVEKAYAYDLHECVKVEIVL